LAAAKSEGLDPERYLPTALESYDNIELQLDGDQLALAELDVSLTVNAVVYATHMSGGAFEPAGLSGYHDLPNRRVDPAIALRVFAYSGFPAEYIKGLSPTHPSYALFKAELVRLEDPAAVADVFPPGGRVKPGQKDDRIPLLRQRMVTDGFLTDDDAVVEDALVLDKRLAKALKAYQTLKGLQQTAALDAPTMKSLSGTDPAVAREQIISSLERLRWMARDFGTRHVFVNQASYQVEVMDQGKAVWTSKVIVGKPLTQTAVFSDQMETVVFNPAWNLPQSILLNEYLPKLRRDPRYLDKIGFKVLNSKGEVTKSSKVNWASVGSDTVIGVQQPPGGANALGEVKFLFPNKHSIYMHDTPNRNLFAQGRRNFSHGCVRVENPREFAQVLLGWEATSVDEKIDSGESTSERLVAKIPVHLTYFTAWPDQDGKIQYFADPYERDLTLLQARKTMQKQYGRKRPLKIVENQVISKASAID
jgi:L,D-transpeptidase YcbB